MPLRIVLNFHGNPHNVNQIDNCIHLTTQSYPEATKPRTLARPLPPWTIFLQHSNPDAFDSKIFKLMYIADFKNIMFVADSKNI